MRKLWQDKLLRMVFLQSAILMGISALAGVLTLDRAKLPAELSQAIMEPARSVPTISLEQVRDFMATGETICIDARSTSEFEKGHVRGAISFPLNDFDQALSRNLDLFIQNKPIIIYCGGEGCDLSHLLARKLAAIGMDQVCVFTAGWNGWKSAGLPIEP